MGQFSDDSTQAKAFKRVQSGGGADDPSHAQHSLAAAAAYEANGAFEERCEKQGQPASYSEAKMIILELCVAAVDREMQTSEGFSDVDREHAIQEAKKQVTKQVSETRDW